LKSLVSFEEAVAVHVLRVVDAEEVKCGGPYVHEPRLFHVDGAVADEYARYEDRIDAVVAAPALDVVFQDDVVHLADGAIPGGAVADVVSDQEIGAVRREGPVEDLARVVDLADDLAVLLLVVKLVEPGDDLFLETLLASRRA